MSGKKPKDPGKEARSPSSARQEQLAEALRANLRRRKAQARGRKAPDGPNGASGEAPEDNS